MKLCHSLQGVRVFHGVEQEICLVMCYLYWEVRLKPSNIALSLALHRLPEKRDVIVGFLYHVINFVWCRELAWSAMDQEMVLLESFYRQALRPWVQAVFYITLHYIPACTKHYKQSLFVIKRSKKPKLSYRRTSSQSSGKKKNSNLQISWKVTLVSCANTRRIFFLP